MFSLISIKEKVLYMLFFILILFIFTFKNYHILLYPYQIFFIFTFPLLFGISNLRVNEYLLWNLIFIMIMFISSFFSPFQEISVKQCFNYIKVALICYYFTLYIEDRQKLDDILNIFVIVSIITILMVIIQTPLSHYGAKRFGEQVRLNSNDLAVKLAISGIICVFLAQKKSIIYFLLAALNFSFMIFTGSRKVIVVVFLSLFFLLYHAFRKKALYVIFYIFIFWFILYFIKGTALIDLLYLDRLASLFNVLTNTGSIDDSTLTRLEMIDAGKHIIFNRPLMGWGGLSFSMLTRHAYAHNNFIELLVSFGFIGLIVYYYYYFIIFINLLKKKSTIIFLLILLSFLLMEYGQVTYYVETYQVFIVLCFIVSRKNFKFE